MSKVKPLGKIRVHCDTFTPKKMELNFYLALCLDAACIVTWVDTLEVVACPVGAAVAIVSALPPGAPLEGVAPGSLGTQAHRTVRSGTVVAWRTIRSFSTGVGLNKKIYLISALSNTICMLLVVFTGCGLGPLCLAWHT